MKDTKESRDSHDFESYFKRATSPMIVLSLLSDQSMYVYQMTQELMKRSNGRYDMSLLYPVIYRLEKQGFVRESGKEISPDNRVRNYYCITDEGRLHLEQLYKQYTEMAAVVHETMAYSENSSRKEK